MRGNFTIAGVKLAANLAAYSSGSAIGVIGSAFWRGNGLENYLMHISELYGHHTGQHFYLVGMGPSLLNLRPDHIGVGPIIAIYESIHLIESWGLHNPVYSLQKDGVTGLPMYAPLIVHAPESGKSPVAYEPQYCFDNQMDLRLPWNACSGYTAVFLSHYLGARDITMLCFDATTKDDRRRAKYENGHYYVEDVEDFALPYLRRNVDGIAQSWGSKCQWVSPAADNDLLIPVESTFEMLFKDFQRR